jgi:hypothetical protein
MSDKLLILPSFHVESTRFIKNKESILSYLASLIAHYDRWSVKFHLCVQQIELSTRTKSGDLLGQA